MEKRLQISCFLYLFLTLFSPGAASGQIFTSYSIESKTISEIANLVDKDTLVIIELDDVLFTPKARMFAYGNPHRKFIEILAKSSEQKPYYKKAIANWYNQHATELVEERWPEFITELKGKGALVYGLTFIPIRLKGIQEQRVKLLENLGIILTSTANQNEQMIVKNGRGKYRGWDAVFYKGIIFPGPFSAREIVKDFLASAEKLAKKILIISSKLPLLKQLDDDLRFLDTRSYNIHYLAIRTLQHESVKNMDAGNIVNQDGQNTQSASGLGVAATDSGRELLDNNFWQELYKFQQQQLINQGIWFEDSAAFKRVSDILGVRPKD